MQSVVDRCIDGLDKMDKVDLFKLGCTIGGDIVIESLLGTEFNQIRFGSNTPLEEMQQLITELIFATFNPLYVLRNFLFGPINSKSPFLIESQKAVLRRLLNIKKIGHEFLVKQRDLYGKNEPISPFIEAYLK